MVTQTANSPSPGTLRVADFWLALLLSISAHSAIASDINAVLDHAMQKQSIPGVSAVVIHDHRVVFSGGRGLADIASGRPMDDRTVMYIGSLSKVLTAVLALQEVERGRLTLGDHLEQQRAITVQHLITHQSGLNMEGAFDYWFTGKFPDVAALAAYLADAPLRFEPGTDIRYSNIGYAALGNFVAQRAGEDFEALLRDRVLEPLAMNDSGARGPAPAVATAYSPPGQLLPDRDRPFAGVGASVAGRHIRMYHDADAMSPAFGAYSTAHDMGKFVRFVLGCGGDEVLSQEMRERMYEPVVSNRGLGLRIESLDGRRVARHGGWFAAYRSHLLLEPTQGIGIVVLTNSDSASTGEIADMLYRALLP
ncbi:MAG: serine hydrolase domain-containing protein [Wenzhouxiangellaceae bacterium]|nr:serine hydrolase domain-containing protein [Wenzhouxiangellaceae bacterium]